MKKDFEKSKTVLWKKMERHIGNRIPDPLREECEQVFGLMEDVDELTDFEGFLKDYLHLLNYAATVDYFSHRQKPKVEGRGRYQRSFEKRLYLVRFVLATRSYSHKRIDWEQVCTQWNKAHPNDLYTKEVLKVNYYRALAIEDIQRIYLEEAKARIIEQLVELFGDARKAGPVIDLYKRALRYAEEAEDMEDETEADLKTLRSKELTQQAIVIIKQQLEQNRKKLEAKEVNHERLHNQT